MAQTFPIPIDSTDLLSESRTDLNYALDALKTTFIGATDPDSGVFADGLIWVNTTDAKMRARKGGATIDIGDWDAEMGHLRKDGTVALTGNLSAGTHKITNLAAPTAGSSDAARIVDVEAKLNSAGGTVTGALTYSGDNFVQGTRDLADKQYAD